jgi:hypothetical protein
VQSNTALEPTTKKVKKVGFVVEFQKVIGDLLAAALRSRKVKKLIGDRGITSHWSGQNCDILVLS